MQRGPDFMKHGVVADSVGGRRKSVIANLQICVTNDDEDTTFLLKVLYRIVASLCQCHQRGQPLLGILVHQLHPLPGLVR